MIAALHQIAQKAEDLERAARFYEEVLGLEMLARFDPPGLVFFDLGGTRLLLDVNASSALLYLRVDDIEQAADALRARGVAFLDQPHPIHRDDEGRFGPPGLEEWMTFFRDSEGNLLALVQQRLPA